MKQLYNFGLRTISGRISINKLWEAHYPCILHWNQNHFVVLYKDKKGNTFYIADPTKGLVKYYLEEFKKHWVSTQSGGEEKGIAMFLEPTPAFYEKKMDEEPKEERSFKFLFGYIKQYRKYFGQIILDLLVDSLLQLILPFLTQSIVTIQRYWSVSILSSKSSYKGYKDAHFPTDGRDSKVLADKFDDSLERMAAVTDRHSTYFALHFLNHQVCLAHLFRGLQYLSKLNTEQEWSEK